MSMRIVFLIALGLATGCSARFPDAPKPPPPDAVSLTSPLSTPGTHGLIVPALAPSTRSVSRVCIDYCYHQQRSGPYVMIIDGTPYPFPEDSIRLLRVTKRLKPEDIENVEAVAGLVAAQRYHTDGRPVILITTKR